MVRTSLGNFVRFSLKVLYSSIRNFRLFLKLYPSTAYNFYTASFERPHKWRHLMPFVDYIEHFLIRHTATQLPLLFASKNSYYDIRKEHELFTGPQSKLSFRLFSFTFPLSFFRRFMGTFPTAATFFSVIGAKGVRLSFNHVIRERRVLLSRDFHVFQAPTYCAFAHLPHFDVFKEETYFASSGS